MKNNNRRSSFLVFLFIFLVGAGIVFYPTISSWLAKRNHVVAQQTYEQNVVNLTKEEKQKLWESAIHYNDRLVNSVVKDPFANIENIDPFDEYHQTLDLGEGLMGYIHISTIDVLLPIYHGVSDEVLEKGVGHIPATALPVGGEGTHAVLTGHTGLSHAKMFDDLTKLKLGDEFYLEIIDEMLVYEVKTIEVVLPEDVSSLQREEGEDKVTLVTCTPYGVNSHRLLVTGERMPYTSDDEPVIEAKAKFPWWILLIIFLVLVLIFMIGRNTSRRAEERSKSNADANAIKAKSMSKLAREELAKVIGEALHEENI